MMIAREFPDGRLEWVCPTCGRRIIMQWPPEYQHIVVVPGDESASHSGAMGAPQPGPTALETAELETGTLPLESLDLPGGLVLEDDPYLEPWMNWLDTQGL
jgi:hypothetical protein